MLAAPFVESIRNLNCYTGARRVELLLATREALRTDLSILLSSGRLSVKNVYTLSTRGYTALVRDIAVPQSLIISGSCLNYDFAHV